MGCYGYALDTTPHMDALAEVGLRFDDVVTPSPWSRPAFAALLTGRYPSNLGMGGEAEHLSAAHMGLATVLADQGYRTSAVLSHPYLNPNSGVGEGFESFQFVVERSAWPKGLSAARVTDTALDQLDESDGRPFFLVAHYADCLHDWAPIQGFEFGDPQYEGPLAGGLGMSDLLRGRHTWQDADLAELRAHYDSELAYVDTQVGRLLAGLKRRGLQENTLIVLTSTHGVELFDHGGLGDSLSLHEELVHVPLMLAGPGVEPGINEVAASLIDLAPTLYKMLGIEFVQELDGVPMQSLEVEGLRILFAETDRIRRQRAAMDERYKLILDVDSGGVRLFDLLEDQREVRDLSGDSAYRGRRILLESALKELVGTDD